MFFYCKQGGFSMKRLLILFLFSFHLIHLAHKNNNTSRHACLLQLIDFEWHEHISEINKRYRTNHRDANGDFPVGSVLKNFKELSDKKMRAVIDCMCRCGYFSITPSDKETAEKLNKRSLLPLLEN